MILYLLLTLFACQSAKLLYQGQLVTTLGVNLPTTGDGDDAGSGQETAEFVLTTNETKDNVELGSDGAGGVGEEVSSSMRGLSGVTTADQYRLSSDFSGTQNPITSNLSRPSYSGFERLGGPVDENSGIFSFNTNGYWLILGHSRHSLAGDESQIFLISNVSTDGGTSFSQASYGAASIKQAQSANTQAEAVLNPLILKVTDESNYRVSFGVATNNSSTITEGTINTNYTSFTFLRLGDL